MTKYKELLASRRFQLLTIDFLIFILGFYTPESFAPVIVAINIYILGIVGIGTVDKFKK